MSTCVHIIRCSDYEVHFIEKQTTSSRGEKYGLTTEPKLVEKQVEVELKTSKTDLKGYYKESEKREPAGESPEEDMNSQKVALAKSKASSKENSTKDISLSRSPIRSEWVLTYVMSFLQDAFEKDYVFQLSSRTELSLLLFSLSFIW